MKLLAFFLTATFALSSAVTASVPLQKAQALSSLIFYLDESAAQRQEVRFTAQELDHLWEEALDREGEELFDAHSLRRMAAEAHLIASRGAPERAASLFRRASLYLTANWLHLNERDVTALFEERLQGETDAEERGLLLELLQGLGTPLATKPKLLPLTSPPLSSPEAALITPHLLPSNHSIRPALDAIFHKQRATRNDASLKAAGFQLKASQPRSFIRVVSHPDMPYFLFKLYLDADPRVKQGIPGWRWLVKRCEGAEKVRRAIAESKSHYFTVPHKWIYPLPPQPAASGKNAQPVILVVEDMRLVSREQNLQAWKTQITPRHLDELYRIISRANGSSYRPDNIHQTIYGNFAFIDTEYPDHKPNFGGVRSHLSRELRRYWEELLRRGGPDAPPAAP